MNSTCRPWDERYRQNLPPKDPSELLTKFSSILPRDGRALDVACGGGRNVVFLAACGLSVVGVDRSWEALKQGRELAREKRACVAWLQADAENLSFPPDSFDVVLCFYYRDPELYPRLRAFLRPGGFIFYETFTRDQLRFGIGPHNPAHLLDPGELLGAFGDWNLVFYRETWLESGAARLVARKPR